MTARTKHGYKGHKTHHADRHAHSNLMAAHTTGSRAEGAPMGATPPTAGGAMPPMGGAPQVGGPQGAVPTGALAASDAGGQNPPSMPGPNAQMDSEAGEQT